MSAIDIVPDMMKWPVKDVLAWLTTNCCDPRPCGDGWDAFCPGAEHGPNGDRMRALFVSEMIDALSGEDEVSFDCHGDEPAAKYHAMFPLMDNDTSIGKAPS